MAQMTAEEIAQILVFLRSGVADDVLSFLKGAKQAKGMSADPSGAPQFLPSGLRAKPSDNLGQFLGEGMSSLRSKAARFSDRFKDPSSGRSPYAGYQWKNLESSMPLSMQGNLKALRMHAGPLANAFKDLQDISSGKLKAGFSGTASALGSMAYQITNTAYKMGKWGESVLDEQLSQFAGASPSMAMLRAQMQMADFHRRREKGENLAPSAGALANQVNKFKDEWAPIETGLGIMKNWLGTAGAWVGAKPAEAGNWLADKSRFAFNLATDSKTREWAMAGQSEESARRYILAEMDALGKQAREMGKDRGVNDEATLKELERLGQEVAKSRFTFDKEDDEKALRELEEKLEELERDDARRNDPRGLRREDLFAPE